MKHLTIDDIDQSVRPSISVQEYHTQQIQDVQIIDLKKHETEDGSFTEVLRLDQNGISEYAPEFRIAQINKSMMFPGSIKAWHLHYRQDEIWNVTVSSHILLGLWDVRDGSSTKGVSMKIALSPTRLVYIPRGVAHGAANISGHTAEILYVVSEQYNKEHPDEQRLAWDSLGKDFWEAKKE